MALKKNSWPVFQFEECKETIYLLHQWTQIVGKVRLTKSPWQNHSWHVSLYVDSQGLITGPIPYEGGIFEIKFDFIRHELKIKTSNGTRDRFSLGGQTVASFYQQLMEKLSFLGIEVSIHGSPNEITKPIPFAKNLNRIPYHANHAQKLWKVMVQVHNVFTVFQTRFTGKSSPIHLFWGSFDLSYSRFSGRKAAEFSGEVPNIPSDVLREAYSHEMFTVGFWPGKEDFPTPCFYASVNPNYPEFQFCKIQPPEAFWSSDLGKFILPYESVQKSSKPQETLLSFLQSAYEHAANAGNWDRDVLDCDFSYYEKTTPKLS